MSTTESPDRAVTEDLRQTVAQLEEQLSRHQTALEQLQRRSDIQSALNDILHISLEAVSLEEQLDRILILILDIRWLALEEKGCVFLASDDGQVFRMVAQHNLCDSLVEMCQRIVPGQCLCGRAAVTQELLFRDCIDHDHDNRPEGMKPHGHYIMPIVSNGRTLGILNLYVKHGHRQDVLEREFLSACGQILAGIIERKLIEQELRRLSGTDELTGIANRRSFMQHLNLRLEPGTAGNSMTAVLFLDLDHFKQVNDTYGHEYGDQLLIHVAQRVRDRVRSNDVVARLGGDEFAILLEGITTPQQALQVAGSVIAAVTEPYDIKGQLLQIGGSIGISLFPEHGLQGEDLLKKADQALYHAKSQRGLALLYDPERQIPLCNDC